MLKHQSFLLACLVSLGCLASASAARAAGDEKKKDAVLFGKIDGLTDQDPKDSKLKKSYSKSYKVKLTEGKAYRIDLSSRDFDTFLRLENAAGKEVAFNDDIDLDNKVLDSRVLYLAPKTGEYRLIVTSFKPRETGLFTLEMVAASAEETKEARFTARLEDFPTSPRAEQKKFVAEVTKSLRDKGEDLSFKDGQLAATIFMSADDSDVKFVREIGSSFAKIFEGASNKRVASLAPYLEKSMKRLDKIGKEIEITGKTLDGKEFDLKKLKGKVVLVDFWGTWCGPCVAEMPNLVEAHKKYNKKGFEVIGVARDESDEVVSDFIKATKLPWACINIEDSAALIERHGVTSYPHPVLVGPDGRIVSVRARGKLLEVMLERLLAEKK